MSFWMPIEGNVTEVAITTSESTEIDLSAFTGKDLSVVIGCDVAFKMSANGAGTITAAKAVHAAGVYMYKITADADFVQVKAITGTGNLSWYIEKGQ